MQASNPKHTKEALHLKTTAKRGFVVLLLVAAVTAGMIFLGVKLGINAEKWATMRANKHLTSDGSFIAAGNIVDRDGETLEIIRESAKPLVVRITVKTKP